jgi:hypothetical protein
LAFFNRLLEATGIRTTWSYDTTYQLVNEHRTAAGPAEYNITYTYDPVGNRLVMTAAGALTTYAYDAANQLQTLMEASGTTTFTFDASGNQQIEKGPNRADHQHLGLRESTYPSRPSKRCPRDNGL